MNNLFESYNNLTVSPSILHGHIIYDHNTDLENYAHKLLRKDCKEYYHVSMSQHTVRPLYPPEAPIESILSEEGLKKYKFISSRIKQSIELSPSSLCNEIFKDEFVEYSFNATASGSWFANKDSQYYDSNYLQGILNCWNDICISGWTNKHPKGLSTSPVIFINEKDGWCITKSGSLYKLGTRVELCDLVYGERKSIK